MKRVCFIVVMALLAGFFSAALNKIAQFDTGLDQRKLDLNASDVDFLKAVLEDGAVATSCKDYFGPSVLDEIKECDPVKEFVAEGNKKASICHIGKHEVGSKPKKLELQLEKESFKFIIEVDSIYDSEKKTFADFFEIAHYFVYFCTKEVAKISVAEIQKVLTELPPLLTSEEKSSLNIQALEITPAGSSPQEKGTIKLTLVNAHKMHEDINSKVAIPPLHYAITQDKPLGGGNSAAGALRLTIKGPYSSNSIVYTIPNPEFIKEQTKEFLLNSIRDYERIIRFIKNYERGLVSHTQTLDQKTIKDIIGNQLETFRPDFSWSSDTSATVECPSIPKIQFGITVEDGGTSSTAGSDVPNYFIAKFFKALTGVEGPVSGTPTLEESVANLEMVVPSKSYYDHRPFLQAFAEDALKQLKVMCGQ